MKFYPKAEKFLGAIFLAAWSLPAQQIQIGWPACQVIASDFSVESIVTRTKDDLHRPLKLAFHQVGDRTNFYFIEMKGRLRYYEEAGNSVKEVGLVKGYYDGEKDGLTGIALDPGFDRNRKVYLFYSIDGSYRISRFLITADNRLDNESEKVLLDIKKKGNGSWHESGSMEFDAYGDLWIGVGDSYAYNDVSLSTAVHLASILRIHPDDSEKGYSIPTQASGDPTGNMGEYWSRKFAKQGEAALAREYADPKKVLPEIYVKGVRNPYTTKVVHPTERWIAFGDVRPDGKGGSAGEYHLIKKPGFGGWALWAGEKPVNTVSGVEFNQGGITRLSAGFSKGGASGLPPVIDAAYSVPQSCAMAGDIYWYDGASKSPRKFPAYFTGKWFLANNDENGWSGPPWVGAATLDKAFDKVASGLEPFFKEHVEARPQDLWFGPDGALYVAYHFAPRYGDSERNRIVRISYKGGPGRASCLPTDLRPPFPAAASPKAEGGLAPTILFIGWDEIQVSPRHGAGLGLYDAMGKQIPLRHIAGDVYRLPARPEPGVYFLEAGEDVFKVIKARYSR